jgi:hypothetical protein
VVVMSSEHPISYLALAVGTPVESSTGRSFGTVEHVLQIPELDLFDGFASSPGIRFSRSRQVRSTVLWPTTRWPSCCRPKEHQHLVLTLSKTSAPL